LRQIKREQALYPGFYGVTDGENTLPTHVTSDYSGCVPSGENGENRENTLRVSPGAEFAESAENAPKTGAGRHFPANKQAFRG
jgi:hypothetical protein